MICLLPNCAYLSETTRMLAIHRALVARGASVSVVTHGGTHEHLLSEAGVPYEIVGPRMSPERCVEFVRNGAGMGSIRQSFYGDDEMATYVEAEAAFFRRRGVRIAVTGFTMTANLSARLAGVLLATEHSGSFLPPLWEERRIEAPLTPIMPWLRLLPVSWQRAFSNRGGNRAPIHLSGFRRVARRFGLPPMPSFAALMLGDLALVTEVPEVLGVSREALHAWQPRGPGYFPGTRLRYTGPLFAELDRPVPERVRDFLGGRRPLVYVAITSSPASTVRAAVAQLRSLGARVLVAANVHERALADLDGGDVLVAGVLPSHRIMPAVDLAVIAGGQGSVQCALASGVPILGIPLQPEQDLNVALLEPLHAGRRLALGAVGTPALATTARALLDDPRYRESARRLQAVYSAVDGPGACAEVLLEELRVLTTRPPP